MMKVNQEVIKDIEKLCKSKRYKKNIYKMDLRLGQPVRTETGPQPAQELSKHDMLLDSQFKERNAQNYSQIMQNEQRRLFLQKGLKADNIYETDNLNSNKI